MISYQKGFSRVFLQKKQKSHEIRLVDVVEHKKISPFVFVRIHDDLGFAADTIFTKSTPMVMMAYGYARRTAAAGLYIQGGWKKADFEYVCSIFKSLQIKTDHTKDFQEEAADQATEYLITYNNNLNRLVQMKLLEIALNYEVSQELISDSELIASAIETMYQEQN